MADKAAGLNIQPDLMDQDANDIALGLSTAMLRDGTSTATADLPMGGHKLVNVGAPANAGDALGLGNLPASEIARSITAAGGIALPAGMTFAARPTFNGATAYDTANLTAAQLDAIRGVGTLLGTSNLTPGQMNAQAGVGQLYGTSNLTAGQIGGILGYAPARPTTVIEGSAGGQSDLPVNARSYVVGTAFVANAPNFLGFGRTAFLNNTSGAAGYTAYMNLDLIDLTANAVAVTGIEMPTSVTYGQGWMQAFAFVACAGLTVGHTYQLRAYNYKTSSGAVIATTSTEIVGECF